MIPEPRLIGFPMPEDYPTPVVLLPHCSVCGNSLELREALLCEDCGSEVHEGCSRQCEICTVRFCHPCMGASYRCERCSFAVLREPLMRPIGAD